MRPSFSLRSSLLVVVLAALSITPACADGAKSDQVKAPKIVGDSANLKKLEDLLKQYQKVARDNYAMIVKALGAEAFAAKYVEPTQVQIFMDPSYDGVAATSGAGFGDNERRHPVIMVSPKYALAHPKDLGMIVHEMVHVVQSYPGYEAGWLVEGIADYVRWFIYEPASKRARLNPDKANARGSYQTTGAFLYWAVNKYDKDLVKKLDAALRANTYKESLFKDLTGKTLDELNTEWVASLRAQR